MAKTKKEIVQHNLAVLAIKLAAMEGSDLEPGDTVVVHIGKAHAIPTIIRLDAFDITKGDVLNAKEGGK